MTELQVPNTMRAAVLKAKDTIEVEELPVPDLPPGGMIIRTSSVGICGSDVIKVRNTISDETRVIGHEIAGEVVLTDERAQISYQIGDRVLVGHVHVPCMHCIFCRDGRYAMCSAFKNSQVVPGGFAQYVAVSADHTRHTVLPVPEEVSSDVATFVDPVACCLNAIERASCKLNDRAAVVGVGTMGALFVQLLDRMGVEVFAIDISDFRLQKARHFGAAHTVNSSENDPVEAIQSLTSGIGVDVVFLTIVNQQIADQSFDMLRDGGTLLLFAGPIARGTLELDYYQFFRRDLAMLSSYSASMANMGNALSLIAAGSIPVDELISGTCDLDGILTAILSMDEHTYKVIVKP